MSLAALGCSFLPSLPFAAVCCHLLPAVFCCVLLCVAACRYCFRLPVSPAILIPTPWRKWPRSVKIVPKWALNGLENGSVEHLGALGRSLRASSVKRVASLIPLWSIRGSLWDPTASQNSFQNALLAEICVRRGVFFAILSATVVFSPFSIHFSTFLFEKSKKKTPCCCTSCRHFLPFQNHAFCRLPCMWSVFLAMC